MRWLVCLLLTLLLGCNLGGQADRLTYEAIAPEYEAYVAADTSLTQAQKDRRHETVRSWEAKLPRQEDGASTQDLAPPDPCTGSGPCGCGAVGCQQPCDGCCKTIPCPVVGRR